MKTFGAEVVEELAQAIRSLGNGSKKKDIDPGVLQSIYGLASVVETGRVSTLNWIAPKATGKAVDGSITKKVRDSAAARLNGPRFKIAQIDGVLDMADFSRRERNVESILLSDRLSHVRSPQMTKIRFKRFFGNLCACAASQRFNRIAIDLNRFQSSIYSRCRLSL